MRRPPIEPTEKLDETSRNILLGLLPQAAEVKHVWPYVVFTNSTATGVARIRQWNITDTKRVQRVNSVGSPVSSGGDKRSVGFASR
jgi:hypothetical protein